MAKNLINKYVWLVETIYKAKRITFEEINAKWLETDMSEGVELALRTFHKWRIAAEEMFGLVIECERKGGYHYYIENAREIKSGSLRSWLLSTISVSNLLIENQNLKDKILLEEIPSGESYLPLILKALKSDHLLSMVYKSYWKNEASSFEVEPYCLKAFKQRWYLVGRSPYLNKVMIYSLDRIRELYDTGAHFDYPKDFSPEDYFNDCFGIIADRDCKVEPIKIKVSANQANYLRDLTLHQTQRELEETEDYSIFEVTLRPTFDFQQELLSMGESVEVLEPIWLRKEIAGILKRTWNQYNE